MATVTITLKLDLPDDVDLSWVPDVPVELTGEQAFSQAGAIYTSIQRSNGDEPLWWEGCRWYYSRQIRCHD